MLESLVNVCACVSFGHPKVRGSSGCLFVTALHARMEMDGWVGYGMGKLIGLVMVGSIVLGF